MKLYFNKENDTIDQLIEQLINTAEGVRRPEYVREMIITALKAGQEDDERADLKLMNTTLKEMRFTSKVFGRYRNFRKVTIFGSARTESDDPVYQAANLFGKKLAKAGFMIITGGGEGIMRAAYEGAGSQHAFGVNIRLPFDEKQGAVTRDNSRSIMYKYFFNRKVAFLKEADAVALFPGGFGTLDEAMETLTLLQTGKRNPMPLVLVDLPECPYWSRVVRLFEEELLARAYICPSDCALFEKACSVDDAVERIRRFYRRYHSIRYVQGRLVMRITSRLTPADITSLNDRFGDILLPGGTIAESGALKAEIDDNDAVSLPRLLIDFNRRSFGRLRKLIDAVNDF